MSYHELCVEKRSYIQVGLLRGMSQRAIARMSGDTLPPSTCSLCTVPTPIRSVPDSSTSSKETNLIARYTLAPLTLAALLLGAVQASASPLKSGRSQCYSYLTELVRSSNFPFTYVEKDKANLLIDDDQGETVSAQVVFDTDGSGTIGWVKYDIQTHQLLNTSSELETPKPLSFDKKYADLYERCISED